ncbi:S1 family peptidase [Streptomyces marincola]|uniref:Peptidase S1 domain-containing protein n=1 Tax=Streptomyces marincola TaxID=2878388 RepID=A0A1W7CSR2_9ACTN|nr:serine protease [Streptomyces marincola]ARQ67841.1 hypothetical protein CAG99_02430 [Streptomyces marincola]
MTFRFRHRVKAGIALAAAAVAALAATAPASAAPAPTSPAASSEPSTRIVGGTPVTTEDYPYVMHVTFTGIVPFCGGTLVAPTKVVTAAHCVNNRAAEDLNAVGGRTERQGDSGVMIGVSDIWMHPEWDSTTKVADIAVLTLSEPMPYEHIPFAGPEDTHLYTPGVMAEVLGWGRTGETGNVPDQLLMAEVPVVSDADCEEAYSSHTTRVDGETMVCAGYPEGGVDACQRDSGGPLVVDGVLIGVVAWGNGCARPGYYGVYTELATYAADVSEQIAS